MLTAATGQHWRLAAEPRTPGFPELPGQRAFGYLSTMVDAVVQFSSSRNSCYLRVGKPTQAGSCAGIAVPIDIALESTNDTDSIDERDLI